PGCPCGLFEAGTGPSNAGASAGAPIELGTKFRAEVGGYLTGVRYYRATTATGQHTVWVWSADGSVLAKAVVGGTASGWQTVELAPAVPVSAGATYVVSYYSSTNGGYAYDGAYFVGVGPRGPLAAI